MCDYSLLHLESRPAKVADELTCGSIMSDAGYISSTKGLFDKANPTVAVCLIPGTEVAFERAPVKFLGIKIARKPSTATFRQINKDELMKHHDALEFADGDVRLVHDLEEGQKMKVLQLPAAPKTDKETADQKRLSVVA
jgi:hypothetical protein